MACLGGPSMEAQATWHIQPAASSNRLSENATRCMVQDQKGYIWIGTIDGLNRYDGLSYELYYHDPTDSTTISGNYIICMLVDAEGRLWIGTQKGVDLYDERYNQFIRLSDVVLDEKGITKQYVTGLEQDEEGQIWISTYRGVARYNSATNTLEQLEVDESGRSDALVKQDVVSVCTGREGRIWLGYEHGWISEWHKGKFAHYQVLDGEIPMYEIFEDKEGKLWLGTGEGIFRLDPEHGKLTKYGDGLTRNIYDLDGEIWMNVNLAGIRAWDPEQEQLVPVKMIHDGQVAVGDVKAFFRGKEGIVWASYHGLFKSDRFEKRMECIQHEKGNRNTPAEAFIRKVMQDDLGNHIVLTINRGVNYYNRQTGQWQHFPKQANLHGDRKLIRTVDMAIQGSLVYVLCKDLLYSLDLKTAKIEKLLEQQMGDREGANLVLLDDGNLLIGGSPPFLYHAESGKCMSVIDQASTVQADFRFCLGTDGHVWAATRRNIYRFDEKTNSFINQYQLPKIVGDNTSSVLSFAKGSGGDFWVGSRSGLTYFHGPSERYVQYTTHQGLPNSTVNSLLLDQAGRLWIGTNKGISVLNVANDSIRAFDRTDGIQDEIFLTNCAYKSPDGVLFFGGVNGYNYFHPDSLLQVNPVAASVWVKTLRLADNTPLPLPSKLRGTQVVTEQAIKIPYKSRSINIELIAIGISQSTKNQYACQLEGVDEQWNYLGHNPNITYSGLPYGKRLVFKAKAANSDGVWGSAAVLFELYVAPPFWATGWFWTMTGAFLLAMAFLYYRWRLRTIKQQNIKLQRAVKEQTTEIQAQAQDLRLANEDLRQQSTIIQEQVEQLDRLNKTQSQFFVGLSHEFRTPITLMLANLQAMEAQQGTGPLWQNIENNAMQLLQLVNELLDVARLDSGTYTLHVREGELFQHLRMLVNAFQVKAKQQGLDLQLELPGFPSTSLFYDPEVFEKILNNLLSNALKYTANGWVKVRAELVQTEERWWQLLLRVRDSGLGIQEDQLPYIFDRFYQADGPLAMQKQGTGIGLNLVQQLVYLHKGTIQVESTLGVGSCFTLTLPVEAQAFSESERVATMQESAFPIFHPTSYQQDSSVEAKSVPLTADAPTLLIVEDNADIRSFIARCLRDQYNLLEAADGLVGLALAKKKVPDLVISDVLMPGKNGFELCEQIKSDVRTSHIPVILLTALSEREHLIKGLKRGADLYLKKPFHREELQLRVKNLLEAITRIHRHFALQEQADTLPDGLGSLDRQLLEKVNSLLTQQLSNENLSVEDVCRAVQLSRSQLFRKLKALTGMSVTEYIRDYRLRKAHTLILSGECSIKEIIHLTGFNSRSYFYTSFRQKYELTPTELRSQQAS